MCLYIHKEPFLKEENILKIRFNLSCIWNTLNLTLRAVSNTTIWYAYIFSHIVYTSTNQYTSVYTSTNQYTSVYTSTNQYTSVFSRFHLHFPCIIKTKCT